MFYGNTPIKFVVPTPGALSKGGRVTCIAIYQAHRIAGHRATRETRNRVSRWFWWLTFAGQILLQSVYNTLYYWVEYGRTYGSAVFTTNSSGPIHNPLRWIL